MNGNRGKALEKTTDFSHLEDDSDSSLFTEKVLNPQHNSENTLHVKNYTARDLNYESKWLYFIIYTMMKELPQTEKPMLNVAFHSNRFVSEFQLFLVTL